MESLEVLAATSAGVLKTTAPITIPTMIEIASIEPSTRLGSSMVLLVDFFTSVTLI